MRIENEMHTMHSLRRSNIIKSGYLELVILNLNVGYETHHQQLFGNIIFY